MLVDRRLTRELVLRVDSFVESIEECPEWKKAPGALLQSRKLEVKSHRYCNPASHAKRDHTGNWRFSAHTFCARILAAVGPAALSDL